MQREKAADEDEEGSITHGFVSIVSLFLCHGKQLDDLNF